MAPKKDKTAKAESAKKEYKLDIFETLRNIDTNNFDWFSKLTDEQRKGFAAPVILRWLSSVSNKSEQAYYLSMVNDYVNADFWEIQKHPELVWKLMCVCGSGIKQNHVWIPKQGSKRKSSKIEQFILQCNPSFNDMELDMVKKRLTKETLKELAEDAGCTDEELKELLAEYKKQN